MPHERTCPRCHTLLVVEDDNTLVFCSHCGAPQIRLSEELRNAAEDLATQAAHPDAAGVTPDVFGSQPAASLPWDSLIRVAALFSTAFSVVAVVLPPLAFFVAPATLSFFASRHREVRITTSLGTRLGLLCGVLCSVMACLLETAVMVTLRLTNHGANPIDTILNERLSTLRDQTVAQSGEAAAKIFPAFFNIAEFRAGLVLGTFAMMMGIVILFTTAGGTLAGYLRSRSRAV